MLLLLVHAGAERPFNVFVDERRICAVSLLQRSDNIAALWHCPAQQRYCAASTRSRCVVSRCPPCVRANSLSLQANSVCQRCRRRGRVAARSPPLRGFRKLVPGAKQLAVVTAVNAVADGLAELDWYRALVSRWSDRRYSAARRACRARRLPGSGKHRCRHGRCRSALLAGLSTGSGRSV